MEEETYNGLIHRYEFTEDMIYDAYYAVKDYCRDLDKFLESCSGVMLDTDKVQDLVTKYDKLEEIRKFLENKLNIE